MSAYVFLAKRAVVFGGVHAKREGIVIAERPPLGDGFTEVRIMFADGQRTRWIQCPGIDLIDDRTALNP